MLVSPPKPSSFSCLCFTVNQLIKFRRTWVWRSQLTLSPIRPPQAQSWMLMKVHTDPGVLFHIWVCQGVLQDMLLVLPEYNLVSAKMILQLHSSHAISQTTRPHSWSTVCRFLNPPFLPRKCTQFPTSCRLQCPFLRVCDRQCLWKHRHCGFGIFLLISALLSSDFSSSFSYTLCNFSFPTCLLQVLIGWLRTSCFFPSSRSYTVFFSCAPGSGAWTPAPDHFSRFCVDTLHLLPSTPRWKGSSFIWSFGPSYSYTYSFIFN